MNPTQLQLSQIILELTVLNGAVGGVDDVLARLAAVLRETPSLGLRPQAALLLFNSERKLLPIAFAGMEPPSAPDTVWRELRRMEPVGSMLPGAIVLPAENGPPQPAVALPLQDDERQIGVVMLFPEDGAETEARDWDFLLILAKALSGLVGRCLLDEIIKVREWELEEARSDAIHRLGAAAEYRDNDTGWHVMRMTNYAIAIARQLGLSVEERELLYVAAPMHDVGKIGVPDVILLKPGRLSEEELTVMRQHAEIGETILVGGDQLTTSAREIAGSHHERWDGLGYPRGLKGEEIPVLGRVCAVADVFDALTSPRPYKAAWTVEDASTLIFDQSGTQFDPSVVEAFRRALPDILRVRELYRDEIIDPRQVLDFAPARPRQTAKVHWDPGLSVGIDVIDEHHRYLFDLVNDCYEVIAQRQGARELARLVKKLEQYTNVHFAAEERMMEHFGYPDLGRHKELHQRFREKLKAFRGELHVNPLTAQYDVADYTTAWLTAHIRHEDAKLKSLTA